VQSRLPPAPVFDLRSTAQRLLHRLRLTSAAPFPTEPAPPKTVLLDTQQLADSILAYFRSRSDHAKSGLDDVKLRLRQATALLELVMRGLRGQLEEKGARFQYDLHGLGGGGGGGGRGSEDSQVTAVSNHRDAKRWTVVGAEASAAAAAAAAGGSGSDPKLVGSSSSKRRVVLPWSSWLDLRATGHHHSPKDEEPSEPALLGETTAAAEKDSPGTSSKSVVRKRKEAAAAKSTAAKLTSWLKRKMMLRRIDEEEGGGGPPPPSPDILDHSPTIEKPLRVLTRRLPRHDHTVDRVYKAAPVLAVARRDLDHIFQHISEVRCFHLVPDVELFVFVFCFFKKT
jgi:hypothetical protein